MPVGMAYLMKDGKEWSGGALPKQDEANKLKLMFRLDNELVSEGR
jgi:hypothetical protein